MRSDSLLLLLLLKLISYRIIIIVINILIIIIIIIVIIYHYYAFISGLRDFNVHPTLPNDPISLKPVRLINHTSLSLTHLSNT